MQLFADITSETDITLDTTVHYGLNKILFLLHDMILKSLAAIGLTR